MNYTEENFIYATGWCDPIAAVGGAQEVNILISSDAPFKAYYITLSVRQGAVGTEVLVANWAGDVNLNDSALGKDLMNIPVAADALAGTGQLPYNLSPPRIFAASTTLVVTFTSNVAARTECSLAIHGSKLYNLRG